MKINILSAIFSFVLLSAMAQNATEIDSKSVKFPRYADLTAITTAISSPTQGMEVYNIATQSNWYYNGSAWTNMNAGSFVLPYAQTQNFLGDLFSITNNAAASGSTTSALTGIFNGSSNIAGTVPYGAGVKGVVLSTANLSGIAAGVAGFGQHSNSMGVYGKSTNSYGVYGESDNAAAVKGYSDYSALGGDFYSSANYGVRGSSSTSYGGYFYSISSTAGYFTSYAGYALITGTGRVGIGTNSPTAQLHVVADGTETLRAENNYSGSGVAGYSYSGPGGYFNSTTGLALQTETGNNLFKGFTQLGNDASAPKIKMKKLSGTTPTTANGFSLVPHGLTSGKIIGIQAFVTNGSYRFIPNTPNRLFTINIDDLSNSGIPSIAIGVGSMTDSSFVMGMPVTIIITYEQ